MADGGAPAWGRRGPLGVRRGAAAFCGPEGPAKPKQGGGAKGPRPLLCGRAAPPPPPLGRWGVLPSLRTKRPFFRTNFLQTKQARRSR